MQRCKIVGNCICGNQYDSDAWGVIFQPLVGKFLDTFGDSGIIGGEHIYTIEDYQVALSILPISLLVVTILAFFIKDHSVNS